ncbi:hypothetical protein OAN13_08925 [Opitutales bacterium]|nr:hypothetical protein [Opitutales bacterium]
MLSAVNLLNKALIKDGARSRISDDPNVKTHNNREWVVAHGLWQWPSQRARDLGNPYLVYPHGMLDPWFKKILSSQAFKKTNILVDKAGGASFVMPKPFVLLQRRNVGWLNVLFFLTGAKKW